MKYKTIISVLLMFMVVMSSPKRTMTELVERYDIGELISKCETSLAGTIDTTLDAVEMLKLFDSTAPAGDSINACALPTTEYAGVFMPGYKTIIASTAYSGSYFAYIILHEYTHSVQWEISQEKRNRNETIVDEMMADVAATVFLYKHTGLLRDYRQNQLILLGYLDIAYMNGDELEAGLKDLNEAFESASKILERELCKVRKMP